MHTLACKAQIPEYAGRGHAQGLTAGTSGNLSLRLADGRIAITPSGIRYAHMTAEDVMVIDSAGTVIEGPHRPSSEWPMHVEIYRRMPEVNAVVHTHSPYATAFAVLNQGIPVILVEMALFLGGDIRVAPIAVQGTAAVGQGAVAALRDRGGCLLQNHGAVSVGRDLAEAFLRAEYVEEAAKICHIARTIGTPGEIPADLVREMLSRVK